jgi:copper chaperone CopZ
MAVQRALAASPGVLSADVDVRKKRAIVSGDGFDLDQLTKAVEALGYRVREAREPEDSE